MAQRRESRPEIVNRQAGEDEEKSERALSRSSGKLVRDDGGAADVGYVRSIMRPDGKLVAVYYYNDRSSPDRYVAATLWDPAKP